MSTARPPNGPDMTVVIPARDAALTIGGQLAAVIGQSRPDCRLEVIVVDDGSLDATKVVAAGVDGVSVIDGPNLGPGAARNAGARMATSDLLGFVDADDVVGDGWAAAVVSSLREHEVVTGPLELSTLNASPWGQTRGAGWGGSLDRFEGAFPYASSCNLGIRRSVFDALGGFDEGFEVGEDLELSLRLALAGHAIHFDDRAVVHYRLRSGLRAVAHQAFRYGRAGAVVAARCNRAGLKTSSGLLRRVLWLVRRVTVLKDHAGRARWVWLAAHTLGRASGAPVGRRR